MPDDAARLSADLLQLAHKQDAALDAADWDGFIALAGRRAEIVAALAPLLQDRQDLLSTLQQIASKDRDHQARLQEASDEVQREIATLRPQQVAMHAYFAGVAVTASDEARFIDKKDDRPR